MPETSYEEKLREINAEYNKQISQIQEENDKIQNRLEEIKENNNKFREEQMKMAKFYGVNWSDLDFGPEYTFNIKDENGKEQTLKYIVKERKELNEIITNNNRMIEALETFRNNEISRIKKEERENKLKQSNRNNLLEEAYKFFTYLDTATTKGYNIKDLTEDEVINLYKDFYNNKETPEYSRIWNETMERMKKNDREIVRLSDFEEKEKEKESSEEVFGPPVSLKNPDATSSSEEVFGPPTPVIKEEPDIQENNANIKQDPILENDDSEEELIEGKKGFKDKLSKFKEWAKTNKKQLIIAGLAIGGIIITGSVIATLLACGAMSTLTIDPGTELPEFEHISDLLQDETDKTITEPAAGLTEGPKGNELYTTSANAAAGINGVSANTEVGPFQIADFNNPQTGEYAGIDPSKLTQEQLNDLKEAGYTVPAYTNDPSAIGLDGEKLAEQNKISGFGRNL